MPRCGGGMVDAAIAIWRELDPTTPSTTARGGSTRPHMLRQRAVSNLPMIATTHERCMSSRCVGNFLVHA
jgi:hypothetical protein